MAAVLAGFLGVIRGVPVYGGDVIEAQTECVGGMIPAWLKDITIGSDGLPRFVVEPTRGRPTEVTLEQIGQVIYSGRNPEPPAATVFTTGAKLAEAMGPRTLRDGDRDKQVEFIEKIKASLKPGVGGPFSGSVDFGGISVRMNDTVVFLTGTEKQIGTVAGFRWLGNLLLVTTAFDNYAVTESEFLGVLRPARKD